MFSARRPSPARWLLAAGLLALLLVPMGLAGAPLGQSCHCGMKSGQCTCGMAYAGRAARSARPSPADPSQTGGKMAARCSMRSSMPMEGRSAPTGPDLRDRLGIFRLHGPGLEPRASGTVVSGILVPPSQSPSPPDPRPPRGSSLQIV